MAASDTTIVSRQLIGRDSELVTLEHALKASMQGNGQTYFVTGDAGVGKSRLISELRIRAATEGIRTIRAQSFEQDAAYPYSVWIDGLHSILTTTPPDKFAAAFGPFTVELVKLLPELAYTLPENAPTPQHDPESEKRRIFDALAYFFSNLARTQPLILIVEDVHWSDKSSLDFLNFFVRRLSSLPLFLLITYRQNEASPSLQHLIAQLDRERLNNEVVLGPLSRPEVEKLLSVLLGSTRPPHSQLTDAVFTYTEGNPFYIEEILKLWLASGELRLEAGRLIRLPQSGPQIPRSVVDTIHQRTVHLSPASRNLLTVASVIGRRFDFEILSHLLAISEADLLSQMKELIASQLVVEETTDQFAFRHALTRESVYGSLLRRERKQIHQRIEETMEHIYAPKLDSQLSSLAYHAYEGEMWQQTLDYSIRAAEQAQSMYAAGEAILHYTRAIEATRHIEQQPPITLFRARGKAYEVIGDFDLARSDYEQTLAIAKRVGDGISEWQALIDLGFLWAAHDYAITGEYFQQALTLARTINEPYRTAQSLNRVGNWYANVEQPSVALRYHDEALTLFASIQDQRGLAESYDLSGMAHQLNSDLIHSNRAFQQAIELWDLIGDRAGLASSLAARPLCAPSYFKHLELPAISLQEAIGTATKARQVAQQIGWRAGEAFALLILAMSLGAHGDYQQALEAVEECLRHAEEIEHSQWIVGAHIALGTIYLDILAVDAALSHLHHAASLAQAVGSQVWIGSGAAFLASTYTMANRNADALNVTGEFLPPETAMQMQWQRLLWYARAEALLESDAADAEQITNALIATTANLTADSIIPRLWYLRGKSLAAQGKVEEALAILLAASDTAHKQDAQPMQWRIHIAIAEVYSRIAQHDAAQEHILAAREIIDHLAAALTRESLRVQFVEWASRQFPTSPTRSPATLTPKQAAKQEFGGLTSREREIALLLAQGKSNQDIAAELFVGVRTVEAHVTRILTKLDFTSRVQIATWVIERKLNQ